MYEESILLQPLQTSRLRGSRATSGNGNSPVRGTFVKGDSLRSSSSVGSSQLSSQDVYGQGDVIWSQLQEIADTAACLHHSVEESSSNGSGSAGESDSLGGGPNPGSELKQQGRGGAGGSAASLDAASSKLGRLSPMVLSGASQQKLKQQLLSGQLAVRGKTSPQGSDLGYHTLSNGTASSSSPDLWDVRATKTPIRDLHILTHNAKHLPVSKRNAAAAAVEDSRRGPSLFDALPDAVILRILSFLTSNQLVCCSRVSRRFYFLSWEPSLWRRIELTGERLDADLALKTILRLLSRNSSGKLPVESLSLGGCTQLTDRGLALVARRCPQLRHLEVQHCVNITNGGLMDLLTKCGAVDHLDVTGCPMVSTIGVHQPPPQPSVPALPRRGAVSPLASSSSSSSLLFRRQLNLQYLDLTDCVSLEDSGLKMVVESCPQLLYLFLRRCTSITDVGLKYVASYCPSLKELSTSDCVQITDYGLFELAKLGPNLRYLSVAKCDQITDSGIKQIAKLCYKLRYLNVRGCEVVSDEAISTLAKSCSRLRSLDIGKCDVTDVGLKLLSEHCPNLKKLSVKSCEMVSDQGLACVSYYCRGLQHLNIQDCPITLEGYRTVKKFCRKCIIEHSNPGFF